MIAFNNFNGLAFFPALTLIPPYLDLIAVVFISSGNFENFSTKSKMIILHATHFHRMNERVTHEGGRKCNISIPFSNNDLWPSSKCLSFTRFSLFFFVARTLHSFAFIFMTFDSKNYWLHDKLSAFIVIYYVPKIVWEGIVVTVDTNHPPSLECQRWRYNNRDCFITNAIKILYCIHCSRILVNSFTQ
jgi:hypothetical protein